MRPVLILLAALVCNGCTLTPESKELARALEERVATYQESQRARIERLNGDYRRTSGLLYDDMTLLHTLSLRQDRELDHGKLTDQIMMNWESKTLPSEIFETLEEELAESLAEFDATDTELESARAEYAKGYSKATLELAKLDRARANLSKLSDEDELKSMIAFTVLAAKVYNDAKKSEGE